MFYSQPLAHRFGNAFNDELESGRWTESDIAVAWVRRSGTKHLESSFRRFLVAGGIARLTVGIDIENTSEEGLSDLLAWESHGTIETSIHHNETDVTFHPKVYLLKNANEARLIVGSVIIYLTQRQNLLFWLHEEGNTVPKNAGRCNQILRRSASCARLRCL